MYSMVLVAHSVLRWAVLVAALTALGTSLHGQRTGRPYGASDRGASLGLLIACDIQLLLGLGLYALWSPIPRVAFSSFGAAMKNPSLRFFTVEHGFIFVLATAVVHGARIAVRRSHDDPSKFRRGVVGYSVALALMVVGIPWPWTSYGRPLFPW